MQHEENQDEERYHLRPPESFNGTSLWGETIHFHNGDKASVTGYSRKSEKDHFWWIKTSDGKFQELKRKSLTQRRWRTTSELAADRTSQNENQ